MNNGSTNRGRFGRTIATLAVVGALFIAFAGPGTAAQNNDSSTTCESTCVNAGGTFGPTVPVSINEESADRFAAIIDGDADRTGRITMNFISVDEGTAVEVLANDDHIAQIQTNTGQVGYVPAAWITTA